MSVAEPYRPGRTGLAGLLDRVRGWLTAGGDHSIAQRVATANFTVRIASAALAYLVQVILARWLGSFAFGVYVYAWTWTLMICGFVDAGLALAAQKFIPAYTQQQAFDRLRGFLVGSRLIAGTTATAITAIAAAAIFLLRDRIHDYELVPLWLACLCLPFFAMTSLQDGIARCYNWVDISLLPSFVIRPLLMLVIMAAASLLGFTNDATTAMVAALLALWLAAVGQGMALRRRLARQIGSGPRTFEPRVWLATAAPIVMVIGFYVLLTYVDIIVLRQYVTPDDVALYQAAAKTISLVTFVYFAVASATAHRFSEYQSAGERDRLKAIVASSVRWTFWPSLALAAALLVLGKPLLWLFGAAYVDAYPLLFILSVGLLARAAVGPAERLLTMLGQQRLCAAAFAAAFALNLLACIALIPRFGNAGAAIATSAALIAESIMLFTIAKLRLGLHSFIIAPWTAPTNATPQHTDLVVERRALQDLTPDAGAWRDLCRRALEPNVFYEAAFALAAAPVFGTDVQALIVRSSSDPAHWLGLLPVRTARHLPMLVGWIHPFAPLGTPLLDRDHADSVMAALLDHIRTDPALPKHVLLPQLTADGPVARALDGALARSGARRAVVGRRDRALLRPDDGRATYLERALKPERRRQLRRLRRGLELDGPVTFTMTGDIARALPTFLTLEAGGWKGAAGTAISQHADIRRFVETAVSGLAAEDKAQVLCLNRNGAPLAAGLVLRSGGGLWYWKIAYDERFRRASPGSQLTLDFTAALLADGRVAFGDSCADSVNPMIDQIWRERRVLADHLIGLSSPAAFVAIRVVETTRRHAISFAKRLRNAIRR